MDGIINVVYNNKPRDKRERIFNIIGSKEVVETKMNEALFEKQVCEELFPKDVISFLSKKLEEDQIIDIELIIDKLPKQKAILLKQNLKYILEWLN